MAHEVTQCQKKANFWSKSDIYLKIDVQINLTGSEREKNDTDLCKSLGFNHTNDEIHIPRAPREEETEILDETRLIMMRSKPDYVEFVLL